jgi:hypothetical protein
MDGSLAKLVRATKLRDSNIIPLVQLNYVEDKPRVTIVVPSFSNEDTLSKRNLEVLVTLAHYGLGIPIEGIFVYQDPEFGTELRFDAATLKMMEDLSASSATPSGAYSGTDIKIGSYNCNLPTILASLHLLALKQSYLRKRTPKKGEKIFYVSAQELRSVFNQRSGLTQPKSYGSKVVRALLATMVSVSNKRFPGSWIRSNREKNNVKTDLGLISVLGYTEKIPYNHKLQSVIFTDVNVSPTGALKLRSKSDKNQFKELSYLEFRSAVSLTCNRLDPSSDLSFDKQIALEPLSVKSPKIVKVFDDSKYFKSIDALSRAHAIMVSCGRSTSKSKPVHYEKARNEFLHTTAKNPIKDCSGREYQAIKDLPTPLLEYCQSLYRFRFGQKRKADDLSSASGNQDASITEATEEKPSKKVKSRASPALSKRKESKTRAPKVAKPSQAMEIDS